MRGQLLHFIHTPEFDESIADVPLTDEQLADVQRMLQAQPDAGDTIRGTGGVRKLRAAVKGKGKRGGARILYYYVSQNRTIYLLLAYDKSEADSISSSGRKILKSMAGRIDAEGK